MITKVWIGREVGDNGVQTGVCWGLSFAGLFTPARARQLVVRSPFMVWAPSGYGMAAILWFRQIWMSQPPPAPLKVSRGHMGNIEQYTVYYKYCGFLKEYTVVFLKVSGQVYIFLKFLECIISWRVKGPEEKILSGNWREIYFCLKPEERPVYSW